jgi:hypothetical protein
MRRDICVGTTFVWSARGQDRSYWGQADVGRADCATDLAHVEGVAVRGVRESGVNATPASEASIAAAATEVGAV